MGYHHTRPGSVESESGRSATRRSIGESLGLEKLGVNLYDAAPGEQVPLKYHYHDEQEECFYVIEGELHVETEEGVYVVGTDELFVVEPGQPHRAFNPEDAGENVRMIAVGAPPVDDHHFPRE